MLFFDLSLADFKARYYRKEPLLVRGGARAILGKLYTSDDFEGWRKQMQQHYPPYVLDSGAMVAVLRASSIVPELKEVAQRFTDDFPGVIAAFDTFCTASVPGGSVGAHFDDNDNFILQQTGRKRWKLARPEHVHPESAHARAARGERLGQVIMADEQLELELEPGDALYIPSFWIHWGIGLGESVSVSLALNPVDTALLLQEAEIYPRVQRYLAGPARAEAAVGEPGPGLAALTEWARCPLRASAEPTRLLGIEARTVLESSSRAGLASLLDALPSLERRPVVPAHRDRFVRGLASLGMLEGERAEDFLASNIFAFLAERALDAIVFADSYKLREIGDVLAELGARLREPTRCELDELLQVTGNAPALLELAGACSLLPVWQRVRAFEPALFELGSRFVPVAARAPTNFRERALQSLTLRIGTPFAPATGTLDDEEDQAVYALGHRVGRAVARVQSAFCGWLAEHALPALERTELGLLSEFCHVYGLLACVCLAEHRARPQRATAFAEAAQESAERVLGDPRVTQTARTILRSSLSQGMFCVRLLPSGVG
jgi:50S ribosomal protein L16 3-hydroxylase